MKKFTFIAALILSVVVLFSACSGGGDGKATTAKSQSQSTAASADSTTSAASNTANTNKNVPEIKDSKNAIDKASISSADASKLISSKDLSEFGLKGDKKDYKYLVAEKGKSINGKDYIEVDIAQVSKENKDGSINMSTAAQLYIGYDGKTIYQRDLKSGELTQKK